jgi:hypothetical protein
MLAHASRMHARAQVSKALTNVVINVQHFLLGVTGIQVLTGYSPRYLRWYSPRYSRDTTAGAG